LNIKKLLSVALAVCLVFCLCACGNENNSPETTEPSVSDTVAPTDEPTEEVTEPSQPAGITYTVTVADEGGNPITGVLVQICQGELCLMPCATDDSGVATFTATEEGAYEAKLLSLPAGYEYATEEEVFHFGNAFELTITLKAVA